MEVINTLEPRPIRIAMKEVKDHGTTVSQEIGKYLEETRIPLSLACVTEAGWPTVLSLWYLYYEEKLWCATQKNAKVVDYLRREPRCAFEIAGETPPYRGVRGQGIVTLNNERGSEILTMLLNRYLGGVESPLAKQLLSRSVNEVAIEIDPLNLFSWDYSERMRDSLPAR